MRRIFRIARIMLKTAALCLVCLLFAGCASNPAAALANVLGVPLDGGEVETYTDTHGGFQGDGITFIAVRFSEEDGAALAHRLEETPGWQELPLSEEITVLLYGIETDAYGAGPYLTDESGAACFPPISEGYYYFKDRQGDEMASTPFNERSSLNFTAVIFDAQQNVLYYGEMDT